MRKPMIPRNEIFENGQHIGMTGSGHLSDRFDSVGKIIDTEKYPNSPISPFIKIELERQDGSSTPWYLDRILEFKLHDDEANNVITAK
jgi:hypothetical protein